MSEEKAKISAAEISYQKPPGLGVRHLQILMMCLGATSIFVIRSCMGAAILTMTVKNNANSTQIEIYDWSEEIRGVILSSFFWGYTLTQIPAGILSKRFGGKTLLLVAFFVNGILSIATPMLAKFGGWIAVCTVRFAMGLTQSCFMSSNHTLLGQWAPPQERTSLTMLAYAGVQIGTIITMPVCGLLASTSIGWPLIFYVIGGLTLVIMCLFCLFTAKTPRDHRFIKEDELDYIEHSLCSSRQRVSVPIPWRQILKSKPIFAILASQIGYNWCFVIYLVEVPAYLKNVLDFTEKNSAMVSALPFVAQWIVSLSFSFLSDHLINQKILTVTSCRKLCNTIGSVGSGLGLIIMSYLTSANKELAIVILTITAGIGSAFSCGYMMNHLDLSPRFAGLLYSLTNCIANLFALLGPLSTGFILGDDPTDISRWRIVFFIAATIVLVPNIINWYFATSELQSWNEPLEDTTYNKGKETLQNTTNSRKVITFSFIEKQRDMKV